MIYTIVVLVVTTDDHIKTCWALQMERQEGHVGEAKRLYAQLREFKLKASGVEKLGLGFRVKGLGFRV